MSEEAPGGRRNIRGRLTKGEQAALRTAAELLYTLDLKNLTVAELAKMPQFSGVAAATLANWARADDWEGKRQDNRKQWAAELKRRFSDQLVHHRYDELMRLKQLQDQAYTYATGGDEGAPPKPPRTFAEAAKVYVALDQALSKRREALLEGFGVAADQVGREAPPAPGAEAGPGNAAPLMQVPEMGEDEYQELAHQLMARGFAQKPPAGDLGEDGEG